MAYNLEKFKKGLDDLQIHLDEKQMGQFLTYYELLVETKIEEKEQVKRILEEEMPLAAQLQVPLSIDVEEGKNWYEAH